MPYASGKTPTVGDYVKNKWEQPGTSAESHGSVSVRWDDGGTDIAAHTSYGIHPDFQAGPAGMTLGE
jgi:hypothetical protein